jgi:hypothetical protein
MIGKLASAISQIEEQFLELDDNYSSGSYASGPSPMNGDSKVSKVRRINEEESEED